MANLTPVVSNSDVYQLETTDLGLAGPGGIMNVQAQALLNRTAWIDAQIAAFKADLLDKVDIGKGAELVGYRRTGLNTVGRPLRQKASDRISVFDFMTQAQITDVSTYAGLLDVRAAVQNAINECAYKELYLEPGRYRLSNSVVVDPTKSIIIRGAGFDINMASGTTLNILANSPAILIDNPGTGNFNPDIELSHFGVNGNNAGNAQHGIRVERTPVNLKEIYVANCQHGVWLENAYASVMQNCITAQNYQHGVYLDKIGNQVLLQHCISNANSRNGGGYAGFGIQGTVNQENLAVTLLGCDATANGLASAGTGSGVIVQYSEGVNLIGHYSEINKTFGVFADLTTKSVQVTGGFFLDEEIRYIDVNCLRHAFNRHLGNTSGAMKLVVQAGGGAECDLRGNTYGGPFGVTRTFSNGAGDQTFRYDTAPPGAVGVTPFKTGDITWHTSPTIGGNVGWVCIAGGPTGLWRPFGTIS